MHLSSKKGSVEIAYGSKFFLIILEGLVFKQFVAPRCKHYQDRWLVMYS